MTQHGLYPSERKLSADASRLLGFPVYVFRDGDWICQPHGAQEMGFGPTPETAIEDCRRVNSPTDLQHFDRWLRRTNNLETYSEPIAHYGCDVIATLIRLALLRLARRTA